MKSNEQIFNEVDIDEEIAIVSNQNESPMEVEVINEDEKKENLCFKVLRKIRDFLSVYALPLFLVLSVIIGATIPQIGVAIDHKVTTYICLVIMFLYSGLYLRTSSIKEALKAYRAAIWGLLSILCVTCIIGSKLTTLVSFHEVPSKSKNMSFSGNDTKPMESFKTGLIVYLCTPCTVSSGILMVTQIDGNYALAVLLTVATNIAGIFTTPLLLKWVLTTGSNIELDISSLLLSLSLSLLLPLLVGKSLRYVKVVKRFISDPDRKFCLMLCSITALAVIILIQVSKTSYTGGLKKLTPVSSVVIIGWSLFLHILFLALNIFISWVLRLERKQIKCIVILASQKTASIAAAILIFIPNEFGDRGLMAIAIVVAHLTILLFDSVLIPIWLYVEKKFDTKEFHES